MRDIDECIVECSGFDEEFAARPFHVYVFNFLLGPSVF